MLYRPAIIAICIVCAAKADGQDVANLNGDSAQTRKRLAEAEQKLLHGKSAEATDDLQRVIDEAGNDFISVDGKHYRPARWLAHGILARLPANALKSYRDRIDDPAGRLLDAAKQNRDPAPLWQLLDRYFVSRPAGEGILLLGEMLFEKGEFRAAERQWRRLLPDSGADLDYPQPQADPASIRARIILALIFQGDTNRAQQELAEFKVKYPAATGTLTGKTGPYAEALQRYLEHPPVIPPAANVGTEWPTFGGGPERSSRLAPRIEGRWPSTPTWKTPIEELARSHNSPIWPPARLPFSHPVVADGYVFLTDCHRLLAFDLSSGMQAAAKILTLERVRQDSQKAPLEASPSLTAAGGRLYVRVGLNTIKPSDAARVGASSIACVVLRKPAEGGPAFKELWRLKPPFAEGQSAAVWEGAPLVAGRRMWIAFSRFEGGRVVQGIACYDPADSVAAPDRPAWAVDVCDGAIGAPDGRTRHDLLTLAGRNIVFCSNTGAVIALDAVTGKRGWAYRYPRARKPDARPSADPTPAVYSAGRIFVAPADSDRALALDPETGQLLWESDPIAGAQIIGVSSGHVIVTSSGPVRGIRGLDVRSGTYRAPAGWIQHNGGGLLSYGKGFVTDDLIVWPTRSGLIFLDPEDGSPFHPEPLSRPVGGATAGCFGNIIYADGVLIIVTPTDVLFYVSEEKQFGPTDSRPDNSASSRDRFERLIQRTERSLAAGEIAAARATLLLTATSDLPRPERAWAAARLLLLTPKAENESKLPADVRTALAPGLLGEWLIAPDGMPMTLGQLVERHLGREWSPGIRIFAPPTPCEAKPEDSPSLSANAEIVRTLKLDAGTAPLQLIPGSTCPTTRFFAITDSTLLAIPFSDRDLSRHAAPARFTNAADLGGGFVAAGPLAVAIYATGNSPEWLFRVPSTAPLPSRPGVFRISFGLAPSLAELSSFRVHGSLLIARLGDRHLIAFDLPRRSVAWVLGSDGRPGYHPVALPGAARFGPAIGAAGPHIFAQLSSGQRWFIRAADGSVRDASGFREETAKVLWASPPVEIEGKFVPFADGPGLVRLLSLDREKTEWVHQEPGDGSFAGDPPQIRAWGSTLVIAVRRNQGVELDRLDLKDGSSVWSSGPAFLDADRVNLAHADADAEHIYTPVGNAIRAINLKDGKLAWEAPLPNSSSGGWIVRAGQNGIIVYPEDAVPREPVSKVLVRVVRSFQLEPAAWRLPGLAAGLYDAWVARTLPVLMLDLESGHRLGWFDIPAAGPAVAAFFERDVAVVATGDRVVWLR